jgi:hypothetical protein
LPGAKGTFDRIGSHLFSPQRVDKLRRNAARSLIPSGICTAS